jgi:uncharacterized protein (TIGR00299 family) protein
MPLVAYLDCFSGLSGDMLLGALVDAGWPLERLESVVNALQLNGVRVVQERVRKHGISGTQIKVVTPQAQPQRNRDDLVNMIVGAALPKNIEARAVAVIEALAQAESKVHDMPVEALHFHEIGAVDTLVDVVGVVTGLHELGIESVHCAPVPWSHGTVQTAHGRLPVPPPAVVQLLEGIPVVGADVDGEMVTPTGAALIRTLADKFGLIPTLRVTRAGYGAGQRDWPDRPNLLRLVLGEVEESSQALTLETLTILACNVDDMNPQWYEALMQLLFKASALDVWLTPTHMKKNRPAIVVEVLCRPSDGASLRDILLRHTTTLGVREYPVSRYSIERQIETVQTAYGPVRIKIGTFADGTTRTAPEHDDCVLRATEHGVSVREVWLATLAAAQSMSR